MLPSSLSSNDITDESIQQAIEELLPTVDLATTGVKKFVKLLSKHFKGVNLKDRSSFITQALTLAINKKEEVSEAEEEVDEEEEEEEEDEDEVLPTKKKRKVGTGGYNAPKELSPELADFLKEKEMSRPQIVKALWDYIKEHNLQNPDNKREIMLDAKLKHVFGCDKFTMFSMNKYISSHCHPFPPLDLTKSSSSSPSSTSSSRTKRKSTHDKSSSSKNNKATPKKKRATGTQPPYRLSDALADVLGVDQLPRPQVVSKLWEYIKANDLQNPQDKREILCDDKLKKLFENKKKVNMFSMNKFISHHLIERVEG